MTTLRALVRVDAGPGIGLGHLQRSMALARALEDRGVTTKLLASSDADVAARIQALALRHAPLAGSTAALGTDADIEQTLTTARADHCRLVIIDSYRAGHEFVARLRQAGMVVALFDDEGTDTKGAAVVINGAVGADRATYRTAASDTLFLVGASFAVLHPSFWPDSPERMSRTMNAPPRILVAIGGSDPHQLWPRLISWIDGLPDSFEIAAVRGPFFDRDAVAASCPQHRLELVDAPRTLYRLLRSSDVVVCGAGQTLCEALAAGTPAIAIQLFDNQRHVLRGCSNAGAVRSAGAVDAPDLDARVACEVGALLRSTDARAALSAAGPRLIDGRGAERVARELVPLS